MKPTHATSQGLRWPFFWVGVIGGLAAFDAWRATKRDGSTLSSCTRRIFNTDDPHGRELFRLFMEAGSAALLAHILKD